MYRVNRKFLIVAALTVAFVATAGAFAVADMTRSAPPMSRAYLHSYNLNSTGLALEGYCPVTYFTANEARRGCAEFTSTYDGVDYRFASAAAKRTFDENPGKYIPAYGGWCAYGMAVQDKFPIDPTNFKIVNDRLMVFLRNKNVDALAKWKQNDEQTQVIKADAHWKKVSQ